MTTSIKHKIIAYFKTLFMFHPTDRVWQMPFFAAAGVGIVLFVGHFFGRLDLGLVAVFGVNAFLYVPNTPIYHRMAVTMCCSFGIIVSFTLGLCTHFAPFSVIFVVVLVATLAGILVRYYGLGPPGYFFFVFSCIVGSFLPFSVEDIVMLIGLITLGTIVANAMALLYSLSVVYFFKNKQPEPIPVRGELGFDVIIVESVIMGFFVGVSVLVGQLFDLERSYWVAVSCAAIMQGISLNAIWIKQSQRIIGTFLGMLFGTWLFQIQFPPLGFIVLLMFLMFMGEFTVVRNYLLAMFFLTPYITYLAEIGTLNQMSPDFLIEIRMIDVIVGSVLGLLGGFNMYHPTLRTYFTRISGNIFQRLRDKMARKTQENGDTNKPTT